MDALNDRNDFGLTVGLAALLSFISWVEVVVALIMLIPIMFVVGIALIADKIYEIKESE